jgi:glycolate oxidase FAD binding subunit
MDALIDRFAETIRAASREQPLRIRGGGSKDFLGGPLDGHVLDVGAYRGIVAYDPAELVITVRCGTPLADVEATLAEQGQMLGFEPPHFGPGATVGGCIASGLSGPRRMQAGAVRDFLLGIKLLDGAGEVCNFGGRVMKNVAGFDVSRMLAGSFGTLGVILEASLKVLPLPVVETTLRFSMDQGQALDSLNRWAGLPLPISASAWCDGQLRLRLSGSTASVAAARASLGGDSVDKAEADAWWAGLREQHAVFFSGPAPLWRLSLPSTAPPFPLGEGLVEWGGSQRWLRGSHLLQDIREQAAKAGGHATLFRGATEAQRVAGVFHPLAPALLTIHRHVVDALDQRGVFSTSRLFPAH